MLVLGLLWLTFMSKIKEVNADIVVVTVSVDGAKKSLANLVSALATEGLKGKVTVMIGGAAVTQEDAVTLGAVYGKTREDAVALAQKAMVEKKHVKFYP